MGVVLSEAEWTARRDAHADRVRRWTGPHHERKAAGRKHPVLDFLFSYYSHRPSRLERWHPGPGVVLEGDAALAYLKWPVYRRTAEGVTLDVGAFARERANTIAFAGRLLAATAARAPRLGCFGLHEWAMVYRQRPEQVRHDAWPLRLGSDGTDRGGRVAAGAVRALRRVPLLHPEARAAATRCSRPARPRSTWSSRAACTPTWTSTNGPTSWHPATPSELVADCFELAARVRELDMRASPYDLADLGYEPVPIETAEGRAEYVRQQGAFAEAAAPLRARLIELTRVLADTAAGSVPEPVATR